MTEPRSPAAERMRRHRQRRRDGLTYLAIEIWKSEIDGLVRLGFLSAETLNPQRHKKRVISVLEPKIVTRDRQIVMRDRQIVTRNKKSYADDFYVCKRSKEVSSVWKNRTAVVPINPALHP
jgi:hypothetical protein